MEALPSKITVTSNDGKSPDLYLERPLTRELVDDLKVSALANATEVKALLEETGVMVEYLSKEFRESLYWSNHILVGRFLEQLYSTGFKRGNLTAKEAVELTGWDYQVCLRALKETEAWLLENLPRFRSVYGEWGMGELLSNSLQGEIQRRKENNNNSPRKSHKKKEGKLDKRGPRPTFYYIPDYNVLNGLYKTATPKAFDMAVLKSNRTYSAAIVKMMKFEGKSLHTKLKREAVELGISRPTLNKYLDATNVAHSKKWEIEVEMTQEEVLGLPEDAVEQERLMKQHRQLFGIVKSKETGEIRAANLDAILGRVPDKAHYRRTQEINGIVGEHKCLPPLQGKITHQLRIGTVVTDNGGFVFSVKKGNEK